MSKSPPPKTDRPWFWAATRIRSGPGLQVPHCYPATLVGQVEGAVPVANDEVLGGAPSRERPHNDVGRGVDLSHCPAHTADVQPRPVRSERHSVQRNGTELDRCFDGA